MTLGLGMQHWELGPIKVCSNVQQFPLCNLKTVCDILMKHLFESRVAHNPGLDGVMDDASAIISHEQTQ